MSALYKLLVRSKAGIKLEETMDFLELAYQRRVNQPGLLKFALRDGHRLIGALKEDGQVEVWRANPSLGLDWYADFRGLFADYSYSTRQTTTFTATVPGQMNLLGRRIIAFPANTSNRSSFSSVKAETVMKTLVSYNATSLATTAIGRDRSGVFGDFTIAVETDLGRGNVISWAGARKNLLSELQKIAEIAGGDFDLVRVGPASWEFRFYPGQLGTDKSGSVVFSLARGNMANPKVEVLRQRAAVALVGGEGREEERTVKVVGSGDGPEVFVDGRQLATAALQSRGQLALEEGAAQTLFDFDVLQTATSYYGLHYGLGDLVKAEYAGLSAVKKVVGVSVSVKGGAEQIAVEAK